MEEAISGGFLFIQPLYTLAFNILIVFYRLTGENLGIAIILFTLSLRMLTLPFSIRQVKSAQKSREFQTKYKEIQAKHKNKKGDKAKEKMTKELAALQSEYLPAQLGGCLPLILQLLFFFQVYYVIINSLRSGTAAFNEVAYSFVPQFEKGAELDLGFLGMNLGVSPGSLGFDNLEAVIPYLLLVLLVGGSQLISGRVMMGLSTLPGKDDNDTKEDPKAEKNKDKKIEKKSGKGKDKGKDVPEDLSFSEALQQSSQSMIYVLPLITMVISYSFPAGLALYWTVNSGFAIIQQAIVHREKLTTQISGQINKLLNIQKSDETTGN